jgi:hypothetical protein
MKAYGFQEQLQFSEGVEVSDAILCHLVTLVPGGLGYEKAEKSDDRNGTDYWIKRRCGRDLSIDLKNRSFCPISRFNSDDACIELASVYDGKPSRPFVKEHVRKLGWTIDKSKQTDFIVYTWPTATEARRFWVVSFPLLCRAAIDNCKAWMDSYITKATPNEGYYTVNTYPPRLEVRRAIEFISEGIAE